MEPDMLSWVTLALTSGGAQGGRGRGTKGSQGRGIFLLGRGGDLHRVREGGGELKVE